MGYQDILARVYELAPKGVTLGLERVAHAAHLLGNPEQHFFSVQIGGTNGKGTVSMILAHALAQRGVRVGLFTSPHLHRFAERIRVDGREAPEDLIGNCLERVLRLNDSKSEHCLSFFEAATLAAFLVFNEMNVEIAVLEVGLGGRLDATTVAEPKLTALTSVAIDHSALLGNTIQSIAAEKAAVARPNVPMVVGALPAEALEVVRAACAAAGAPLFEFGRDFSLPDSWKPPFPGAHHKSNIAVAEALYQRLVERFPSLRLEAFADSLPTVERPGRFEIIRADRRYILDCAHNLEAATALVQTLADEKEHPAALLYGALRDKPAREMLALYRPAVSHVVLMPPPIHRAEDPALLAAPEDIIAATGAEALAAVADTTAPSDTVLVTGSLFTVAAVRAILLNERADAPVGL